MNTMLKTAIFAAALLMLGGCATKALTPEEQAFQNAQNSCTEQTNSMIGGSRYSWGNELSWSNYFEWCMQGKGYKAIATYLGVTQRAIAKTVEQVQKKALAIGLTPNN